MERKSVKPPPLWMMRQAGRYLPEYREVRAKACGFVELCLTPKLAVEVTLQPLRRFQLDAAIIFSDILIVPYALGVRLWFEEGEGPRLNPVADQISFERMRDELDPEITERVYEAISEVRAKIGRNQVLIGFCGAPWTVASYLVAGCTTEDQKPARELAETNKELFAKIIERLISVTTKHLIGQLKAGADLIQIFDTWAGVLDARAFEKWCLYPTVEIVRRVRAVMPNARIILFPKGVTVGRLTWLARNTGADAVGIDQYTNRKVARASFSQYCAIQGNLDPDVLVKGGIDLDRAVDAIKEDFSGVRHIFNLGHGIKPMTPIAHIEQMIERVRKS